MFVRVCRVLQLNYALKGYTFIKTNPISGFSSHDSYNLFNRAAYKQKNNFNLFLVKNIDFKRKTRKREQKQTIGAVSALRAEGLLRMAALDLALPSTKT